MWSTGEGNGKPLQYSCLENLMNSMVMQKDRTLKDELPRSVGTQYATGDQWRNNFRKNEGMEQKQKQYPYDYTVEVRNRFKGLDLIDRVPDGNEVRDIVEDTGIKIIPMEKKRKKRKIAAWGGLTNNCEKKRSEKQGRKGKI